MSGAESGRDGPDWVELVEMLQFIGDWPAEADREAAESLRWLVEAEGLPREQLVADLVEGFGLLLGGNDGEELSQLNAL